MLTEDLSGPKMQQKRPIPITLVCSRRKDHHTSEPPIGRHLLLRWDVNLHEVPYSAADEASLTSGHTRHAVVMKQGNKKQDPRGPAFIFPPSWALNFNDRHPSIFLRRALKSCNPMTWVRGDLVRHGRQFKPVPIEQADEPEDFLIRI